MDWVQLELENCHGISALDLRLNYSKTRAVAVYASNGTMKSSLARTFLDISEGRASRDRVFTERLTRRRVTKSTGEEIAADEVVVITSYDASFQPGNLSSSLLVNSTLRAEYEDIVRQHSDLLESLKLSLSRVTKLREPLAPYLSKLFGLEGEDLYSIIEQLGERLELVDFQGYAELPYSVIFNDATRTVTSDATFRSNLEGYIQRLKTVLAESSYFHYEHFNFHDAGNFGKSLKETGFFESQHQIQLNDEAGSHQLVGDSDSFQRILESEKARITSDAALVSVFNNLDRALNKNSQTREFLKYLNDHPQLIPEIEDLDQLERKYWLGLLADQAQIVRSLNSIRHDSEARRVAIRDQALREETQWERVIEIFNERFLVPFRVQASNRIELILGQEELPHLQFEFIDGERSIDLSRDELLRVLSTGEQKALYILNVLFLVESRRSNDMTTLFVIDDLADSFDYANKTAIIHYLYEMSVEKNFRLLILTHNFDFFRSLQSRNVVTYSNCFMAFRSSTAIEVSPATDIKNPFIKDFNLGFDSDLIKRIATIPFLRNLIEYTRGESCVQYQTLTSLLHWRTDSPSILHSELDSIYADVFHVEVNWPVGAARVVDGIFMAAELAAQKGSGLAEKIALSLAIRLKAEKHMNLEIAAAGGNLEFASNQTQMLWLEFEQLGLGTPESREILRSVTLMTPEVLHLNAFMYEPLMDLSMEPLRRLFDQVRGLKTTIIDTGATPCQ